MFRAERGPGRAMPGNQYKALCIPALVAVTLYVRAGLGVSDAINKVYQKLRNRQVLADKKFDQETIKNWREALAAGRLGERMTALYHRALQTVSEQGMSPEVAADNILSRPLQ